MGDYDVPLDNITYVSRNPNEYGDVELEKYNAYLGMLSTVKTVLVNGDDPYELEGIVARIEKDTDGVYATLDEVILSVTDIDKGAYESEEAYLNGMKGKQLSLPQRMRKPARK